MSAGSRNFGSTQGPWAMSKQWSGGSDKISKSKLLPYDMVEKVYLQTPIIYPNQYYPYVPPAFEIYAMNLPEYHWYGYQTDVLLKCLSEIRTSITGHDFDAAVFAAESLESLAMLRNSLVAAFGLLFAVASMNPQQILRALPKLFGISLPREVTRALKKGDVASVWLALQYGWKPLVADVDNALEAYRKRHEVVRMATFKVQKSSMPRRVDLRNSGTTVPVYGMYTYTCTYTVRIAEPVSSYAGLGLNTLSNVVWEKIPFSFVADWFIPIGNYLKERSFFRGLNAEWCRTDFQRVLFDNAVVPDKTAYPNSTNGRCKGHFISMKRYTGLGSLSIPLPGLRAMEAAFSTGHLQNLSALVFSLIEDFTRNRR